MTATTIAIGATTASTIAQSSSTPTTTGLLSSTTNMVASTPTPADNTPLIVGVVVGSLLFLALVALVVFFVRRRNSKAESVAAMPARSGDNDMVSARNDYGQLPGVKMYGDVADVRAIPANNYGNLKLSPKAAYDAPDSPFTL
jgi:hypothetical protein